MADALLGYKLVRRDGSMARFFAEKNQAVAYQKHPSNAKRYPGSHVHAVWVETQRIDPTKTGERMTLREEVVT